MSKPKLSRTKRIDDEKVKTATGKTWPQWFKILDKFPKDQTHTERAAWLYENYLKKDGRRHALNGAWWCQMVTVTYEQARGLREKHEAVGGFQVSASKTLPISVKVLYQWFVSPAKQKKWLDAEDFKITTATPSKSVRIRWKDGTRVDVGLIAKGPKKSSVALQHEKLKNAIVAKKQQEWWREQLEKLVVVV